MSRCPSCCTKFHRSGTTLTDMGTRARLHGPRYTAAVALLPGLAVLGCQLESAAVPCAIAVAGCVVTAVVAGSLAADKRTTVAGCGLALCRCTAALLLGTAVYCVLLVLLGASIRSGIHRSVELAAILSVSTIVPVMSVNRLDGSWRRRLGQVMRLAAERPVDCVASYGAAAGIAGAWVGAAAIPLDWGAWWQVWPISCELGLALGHVVGVLHALTRLKRGKLPEHQM